MNTDITNTDTLTPEMQAILAQMDAEQLAIQTEDEKGDTDVEVTDTVTETVTIQ